ncbi:hypothetical protein DM860_003600 [Cuscuta australis]|uniref:BHLH domain-containing protein n=1 Tax=Cuscuta australis TaxID=267555 RepID=A0A328DL06_9ASTE|nr:hypothetical protein DM860_003600 [Cuscuta australis]
MIVDSLQRELSADFCITEEISCGKKRDGRSMERKKKCPQVQDDGEFKSKNLIAERRRREKLSRRLLELRASVPNITNMTKETIITDAISYIEELQSNVKELSNELLEMGSSNCGGVDDDDDDDVKPGEMGDYNHHKNNNYDKEEEEDMKICEIEGEVLVAPIAENKLWIKIICKNRKGVFTKLMEAMKGLGAQLNDTSATASKGALLVTSTLELGRSGRAEARKTQEFLEQIIKNI